MKLCHNEVLEKPRHYCVNILKLVLWWEVLKWCREYKCFLWRITRKICVFFFFNQFNVLSRLCHSYWDKPISRWGETGVPRESQLTHPQAELDWSHMWPVWGSNPHQPRAQWWDDWVIKGDYEISHINNSATGATPEKFKTYTNYICFFFWNFKNNRNKLTSQ